MFSLFAFEFNTLRRCWTNGSHFYTSFRFIVAPALLSNLCSLHQMAGSIAIDEFGDKCRIFNPVTISKAYGGNEEAEFERIVCFDLVFDRRTEKCYWNRVLCWRNIFESVTLFDLRWIYVAEHEQGAIKWHGVPGTGTRWQNVWYLYWVRRHVTCGKKAHRMGRERKETPLYTTYRHYLYTRTRHGCMWCAFCNT